jgi:predicted transcriptional regulator
MYSVIKVISRRCIMASTRQLGLRLDESDKNNLKRVAEIEGRSEQDVLRDSLRMYVRSVDEQQEFISSVERGWYELRSGLGEVVTEEDGFLDSVRKEILNEKKAA